MTVATRERLELWAAARTVTEHGNGIGCNRCTVDGCPLWSWADLRLRQWEAEHGQRYPGYAPSWKAVRQPAIARDGTG